MSRSNYDKPFYVDVGTSVAAIRCVSNRDVVYSLDHNGSKDVIKIVKETCDRLNQEAKQFYAPKGSSAAMREALLKVKRLSDGRIMFQPAIREAHKAVEAALAAPPRNCDVGTAGQQDDRMAIYCQSRKCESCQLWDNANNGVRCEFTWSQMPYEATKEGGAE